MVGGDPSPVEVGGAAGTVTVTTDGPELVGGDPENAESAQDEVADSSRTATVAGSSRVMQGSVTTVRGSATASVAGMRAMLPDTEWIEQVGPVEGVALEPWDLTGPLADGTDVAFVVQPYLSDPQLLRRVADLPDLQVVQLLTAGFETALPFLPDGVSLCNAAGVHDASTAEQAVGLAVAALRGIPDFVRAQDRGQWLPVRIWPSLTDRRVLVVGYGRIGRAITARLLPFEVSVTAVASRARAGDEFVERVHGLDELPGLLPEHDVVILIVPLTPTTTRLVDADFLAALPDGALLVNVARGGVVDTDALVAALQSGRITAALDVTDPEPLPAGHPLWNAPGVLISPHIGGATTAFQPRAVRLVRQQLQSLVAGQPLDNVVG